MLQSQFVEMASYKLYQPVVGAGQSSTWGAGYSRPIRFKKLHAEASQKAFAKQTRKQKWNSDAFRYRHDFVNLFLLYHKFWKKQAYVDSALLGDRTQLVRMVSRWSKFTARCELFWSKFGLWTPKWIFNREVGERGDTLWQLKLYFNHVPL